jgi:hypothetical protein
VPAEGCLSMLHLTDADTRVVLKAFAHQVLLLYFIVLSTGMD